MGYTASIEFSLTFPSQEALDTLVESIPNSYGLEGFDRIIEAISENADWTNPEDDMLTFQGWGAGKLLWDHEDMLRLLADAGVTGTIDGRGEDDALWRWRFAEGTYVEYSGVIKYPEDPED